MTHFKKFQRRLNKYQFKKQYNEIQVGTLMEMSHHSQVF